MKTPLLEVKNFHLTLLKNGHPYDILKDISFSIYSGEIIGLIGESGCGKSLMASSILGLLPSYHHVQGNIYFEDQDLLKMKPKEFSQFRGKRLSLILQDPSLALSPLIPIGKQLIEGLCYHKKIKKDEAYEMGVKWLAKVGITDPRHRMSQYPHEISGGMKQRILIAMALICEPALLIADEPTTALDVTIQIQILDLLQQLQQEEKMSILLITHDLGVIAKCCQRAMVMYGGRLVEIGSVEQIFTKPKHPYTRALLRSRRSLEHSKDQSLFSLEGSPLPLHLKIQGCSFAPRCESAMQICVKMHPPEEIVGDGSVRCWLTKASRRTE